MHEKWINVCVYVCKSYGWISSDTKCNQMNAIITDAATLRLRLLLHHAPGNLCLEKYKIDDKNPYATGGWIISFHIQFLFL